MKTNKTVSTKTTIKNEDGTKVQGAPIKTDLTIDWDGCNEDDIRNMAQAALIVKLQGSWRSNGTPSKIEVKAVDHKVGARVAVVKVTLDDLIEQAKSDPVKKAELLARLNA